ncbi:HDG7 [Hepatospora eriocheir]|uniref:HDG7 n=1 Tax=Hepatospora eriocheir TaxID=1081669 RepID=A0A1X0QH77_9MICR|nr:HDG7 [Hepatospora eriocheir]
MRNINNSNNSFFDGSKENRLKLTSDQTERLKRFFNENPKPNAIERVIISNALNISSDKIKNWFQNYRAKLKNEEEEKKSLLMRQDSIFDLFVPKVYPLCNDLFKSKITFKSVSYKQIKRQFTRK